MIDSRLDNTTERTPLKNERRKLIAGEGNQSESIHFQTRFSGELIVRKAEEAGFALAMDLPWEEPTDIAPAWAQKDSPLIQVNLAKQIKDQGRGLWGPKTVCKWDPQNKEML